MTLHLQEIALAVEPGAHAVLFVDQAGWHVTAKLGVPENSFSQLGDVSQRQNLHRRFRTCVGAERALGRNAGP
jgi:hypothetical protein